MYAYTFNILLFSIFSLPISFLNCEILSFCFFKPDKKYSAWWKSANYMTIYLFKHYIFVSLLILSLFLKLCVKLVVHMYNIKHWNLQKLFINFLLVIKTKNIVSWVCWFSSKFSIDNNCSNILFYIKILYKLTFLTF